MKKTTYAPISILWFGTGSMTQNLLPALDTARVRIQAFIDERAAMHGKLFWGLHVIGLLQIHDYAFEYIFVGARNFTAIKKKLTAVGVSGDIIYSLDFENRSKVIALQKAAFQECLGTVLCSEDIVSQSFSEKELLKTIWLKNIAIAWDNSLTILGMQIPETEKNNDIIYIAVRLTSSVGDSIFSLAWIKEFYKQATYKLQIDIFAPSDYVGHLLYNKPYIHAVYPEHLFTIAQRYTLKLSLWHFVQIEYYPQHGVQLPSQLLKQMDQISSFKDRYKKYISSANVSAWVNFCNLRKWNRWDELGANQAINFSRESRLEIDIQPDAFTVLDRYCLAGTSFITLHTGGHEREYSTGTGTKLWPLHHWNAFCRLCKKKYPGLLLVQIGGSHCLPMEEVDICLIGKTSQEESTVLLKQAVLHIDGEGGLVHTRRQLSGRSIVLFGPTPMDFFSYPHNVNVLSPRCSNCMWLTDDWFTHCPRELTTPECMEAISAASVLEALTNTLMQVQSPTYRLESLTLYSTSTRGAYEPVVQDICSVCGLEQKPMAENSFGVEGVYLRGSKQWEYPYALEKITQARDEGCSPRIVEIGGGKGALAWYLAQKGHNVTVYDTDYAYDNNDKDANRRYMQFAATQGYTAGFGSVFNIPEEDDSVDIVLCISVVEHILHKYYAFKEMLRVLRPGGKLIVTYDLTLEKHADATRTEVFTPAMIQAILQRLEVSNPSTHQQYAVLTSVRDAHADKVRLPVGMTIGGLVITKLHQTY